MSQLGDARWDSFCLTPFLASKQGLCVHIFLFLTPNYYQSHCVISHHLTQQMAIFHPITPHLFYPLYLSPHKHCYVLPRLTPLSHLSSSVYHLTPLHPPVGLRGPTDCVGINFTLLMFITSSPSLSYQCTWTVKDISRVLLPPPPSLLICSINTDLLHQPSFLDGELYAGTSADFMGRDFAIFRTLGKHHPIRTEQHDSRWLNGERFSEVLVYSWHA